MKGERVKKHGYLDSHLIVILLILLLVFSCFMLNIWYFYTKNGQIDDMKHQSESYKSQVESKIKAVTKAKKAFALLHKNSASVFVVVNKKNPLNPKDYVPTDLVAIDGATISQKAARAFDELFNAAKAAGESFYVTSGYRSYSNQISTYNYWVTTSGQAAADTYSARAGYSEHQTGLAVDVAANGCTLSCFGSTTQYTWLQEHASDYGFIQRYYKGYEAITGYRAEEWHYRYVGKDVAKDMKAKNIKTLEQYWDVNGGDY